MPSPKLPPIDATHLADYDYLGLGAAVIVDYTEPGIQYTLVDLSEPPSADPTTGDIYSSLDRFSRVKGRRWPPGADCAVGNREVAP